MLASLFAKKTHKRSCCKCQTSYTETKEVKAQRTCLATILEYGNIEPSIQQNACVSCLIKLANKIVNEQVDTVQVHTFRPKFAKKYEDLHHNKFLIEGIDYQTDARGRWILSRWHLLKREKCCGSGCRNCPYGHVNVKNRV